MPKEISIRPHQIADISGLLIRSPQEQQVAAEQPIPSQGQTPTTPPPTSTNTQEHLDFEEDFGELD